MMPPFNPIMRDLVLIHIAILVTARCQASNIHTIMDMLIAANQAAKAYLGEERSPIKFELIGSKKTETAYNRSSIDNIRAIQDLTRPDIVILPGAFEAAITEQDAIHCLDSYQPVIRTLKQWHADGTLLASACTGNFLLAKTEVLNGREITCHWAFSALADKLFPHESFQTNRLLIDHGDVISAGGAMAVAQLVLYILAREHSRELARITAKMMLIEMNFDNQSRFAMFIPNHKHSDQLVAKLQKQIETHCTEQIDLPSFSSRNGLSEKQIVRRFKQATGETPLSYLQKVRVEYVKVALESGAKSINQTIWEVGYEDVSSFRRLFKKLTGLTLQEYRNRFANTAIELA